jgi:REP element-mobilizing transposase RayT
MIGRYDRHWLLTWTTYGTWLPGDRRGFVSRMPTGYRTWELHNTPRTPCDANVPEMEAAARRRMRGPTVFLKANEAQVVLKTMQQTAAVREHGLFAVAVMANHTHLAVGVIGDPEPEDLMRDFKAYASRSLNEMNSRPAGSRWWTRSGSKRKLPDENAVRAAVRYLQNQHRPLAIWIAPEFLE